MVTALKLALEFMAPYNQDITVVFLGDTVNKDTREEFITTLQDIRAQSPTKLKKPKTKNITVKELFKGKLTPYINNTNIIYMDENVSHDILHMIMSDTSGIDDLDLMLYEKYLMGTHIRKYVFDLSRTNDQFLNEMMFTMDHNPTDFNYLVADDFMSLWLHYMEEISKK